jgi:hypothetical protein
VNLDYWNQFSQLTAVRIGGRVGRFESDFDPEKTDTYEVSVGLERQFSARVQGSISVGAQRSERASENDTGYLIRIRGTRLGELGGVVGEYEHSLQPSGFGELLESDTALLRYSNQPSDRWEVRFDARGYRTKESFSNAFVGGDRKYAELSPSATWAMTEYFSVGAFYRYRWVDRENEGSGSGNAVGLTLSLHPRSRI